MNVTMMTLKQAQDVSDKNAKLLLWTYRDLWHTLEDLYVLQYNLVILVGVSDSLSADTLNMCETLTYEANLRTQSLVLSVEPEVYEVYLDFITEFKGEVQ